MNRLVAIAATLVVSASFGCRCGPLTRSYLDVTDCIAENAKVNLDHVYCPATDPTRVGRPDWCRSVPDCLCRLECCRCPKISDVPEPQFRVYPQPETGIGSEGPVDEVVEEELESVLPAEIPPLPEN